MNSGGSIFVHAGVYEGTRLRRCLRRKSSGTVERQRAAGSLLRKWPLWRQQREVWCPETKEIEFGCRNSFSGRQEKASWSAGGGWSEEPRKSVCGSISRAQSLRLEGSVFFPSLRTLVQLGPECSVLECHWKGWIESVLIPADARCPEVK